MRILRGDECPRCKVRLRIERSDDHAKEVLAAIRTGWERSRVLVYGIVMAATFLTGFFPMAAAVATTIAMTLANVLLIRRPLQWLPIGRRVWTWMRIDAWFLFLALFAFLLNAIAAWLLVAAGLGAALSAFTGFATTLMYVEGALTLVANEVERASTVPAEPKEGGR